MPAKKVPVANPDGSPGQGVEVFADESLERWSEFKLEDGTELRMKLAVVKFVRVDDQYDADGNPIYAVNGIPQLSYVSVPDALMRKPAN